MLSTMCRGMSGGPPAGGCPFVTWLGGVRETRSAYIPMKTRLSVIESLESKIAPAGTVIATIAGGVLTLTGDLSDNAITITEVTPDHFTIVGAGGTLIKLGAAAAAANVEFDGLLDSIKSDMKEGNDVITLMNVTLSKDLTLVQGLGNNTTNATALNIGGNLAIQGASGTDIVTFATSLAVGGNATLALGDGANTVSETASFITIGGALNYTGGTAVDTLNLSPTAALQLGSVAINLGINAGSVELSSGTDVIVAGGVSFISGAHSAATVSFTFGAAEHASIGGGVTVKNGLGNNLVSLGAGESIRIGGATSITNGDASTSSSVGISSSVIKLDGGMTVKNGNGVFTNSVSGTLDVTGGIAITNGNSGGGTTTNQISGASMDISGGITIANGSGTYTNSVNGGDVSLGGGILFSNVASGGASTTNNTILVGALDCASVTFTNGAGRFANALTLTDGRISGNVAFTTGDATGTVTNSITNIPAIGGSLIIKNGNGNFTNTLNFVQMHVGGSVSVSNGTANTSTSNILTGGLLDVDGSFSITNKGGNVANTINAPHVDVKGAFGITNGNTSGTVMNSLVIGNEFRVGGNLSFVNGDGVFNTDISAGSGVVLIGGNLSMLNGSQSMGTSAFVIGSTTTRIGGGVTFKTLSGNTTIQMAANANTIIGGAVSVTTGDGNDTMQLSGNTNFTSGGITVNMGSGSASTTLGSNNAMTVKGSISHTSLAGDDVLYVFGPGRVSGGVNASFGTGASGVVLLSGTTSALEVLGPVSLNLSGLATGSTVVFDNLLLGGTLSCKGGAGVDTFGLGNSSVRGNVAVNTFGGADSLVIENCLCSGTVSLQTGLGADSVTIEGMATGAGSTFAKAVTISTGDDADTIIIAGATANRTATFKAGLTLDGGNGTDTYTPGANLVGTVTQVNLP